MDKGALIIVIYTILICCLAGMGAGIGTGLAGMSAATVISPMLITFLGMDAYEAIGIALASDVLASAVSSYTYGKNKNIDIKNGLPMMAIVLAFTCIGSIISSYIPTTTMGGIAVFGTLGMGIKFLIAPVNTTKQEMEILDLKKRRIKLVCGGIVIGLICGFMGAGGGIMMLLILTTVLGYELKTAVGTSVFIMTFTALTGAASHFIIGGMPQIECLLICVLSTLIWAKLAATFANRVSPKILNKSMGDMLCTLGVIMIYFNYFM
ncbi:MAG: sulfite exporter TauE/SafE family protein [Eubacteriales bacterium]